jgi:hypothetical protein
MKLSMLLAQKIIMPGVTGTIEGPLNKPGKPQFTSLSSVLTVLMPTLFAVAGLLLFGYLVWGGFDYLLAMGDPKKAEVGKTKITNAIIGFVLIFAAFWITQIVDYIFKLHIYTP